ncbi:hypothetical protein BT69DRAFT_506464 [Atractiella rhizophila]|nr:hypothetical protein BT69DRAFT_506464 [Atractiella rhizophila]
MSPILCCGHLLVSCSPSSLSPFSPILTEGHVSQLHFHHNAKSVLSFVKPTTNSSKDHVYSSLADRPPFTSRLELEATQLDQALLSSMSTALSRNEMFPAHSNQIKLSRSK